MKPELKNLKEYTDKLSLSQEEKFDMFQNIRTYSNTHPVTSSPYMLFMKYSIAYTTMFAILIGTSATSLAAEQALPGDILYPIKTNINEKVAQTLTFSKKQKTQVTVKLVGKRMGELEKMLIEKKDTPAKIDIVVQKLDEHKEDIKEIQKSETEQESKDSADTYTELESMIDTHIEILEDIMEDKKESEEVTKLIKEEAEDSENSDDVILPNSVIPAKAGIQDQYPENEGKDEEIKEDSTSTLDIERETEEEQTRDELILEAKKFSTEVESIITSSRERISSTTDDVTTTKTKENTRKRILEEAEEKLDLEL